MMRSLVVAALALLLPTAAFSQAPASGGLDPRAIGKPPVSSWPTYHGDYTAQRFSTLTQIDQSNVKGLTLAWSYRLNIGETGAILGGDGPTAISGTPAVKATPLMVDGVLYFAAPDHVWAVDARTGRENWHYFWKTTGGLHIGNRGVGMYHNWIYFMTPDDYLVSLDATTGKERWRKQIASVKREYFTTTAPIVVGDRLIITTGGDTLDIEGYVEALDPATGNQLWRWYTTPRKGDPALKSWPSEAAAIAGAGHAWVPGSYDAELGLYYVGTGNPNPVLAAQGREGDNLWTASIVALDINTGKMRWYYQVSAHDTHDYDAAQDLILIDGVYNGKPRKLLAQMGRSGHYFLFDRATGEHLLTTRIADNPNWTKGIAANGQPIRDPAKDPSVAGTLVSPSNPGVTNWPPPTYSPKTGLIYVGTSVTYSIFYLTDTDAHPHAWGGIEKGLGTFRTDLNAFDYKTGKLVWRHPLGLGANGPQNLGAQGLLSTAGGLVFGNDGVGNFVAYRDTDGKPLWHADIGQVSTNGPISYLLDGKQYVVVGAGDTLYGFSLQ